MKRLLFLLIIPIIASALNNDDGWETFYEKSGHTATPRYAETIAFAKKMSEASPYIHYTTFGVSPQGRALPLLIINKNQHFTAKQVRQSGQAVYLIQAGIHSGEIDGKDAGFMLIRDMVFRNIDANLLNNVTILFMPIFSVDGHERFSAYNRANQNGPAQMGWRVTAQNYNLNRDYLKADAPEMQAWLKLYSEWLPEFFADCHVTDGADYQYTVTYNIEQNAVLDPNLIAWTKEHYLPVLKKEMDKAGFPIIEYVSFVKRNEPKKGLESWVPKPRFSNGYTSLQNRLGLLIETHMFKSYKQRVDGTYHILKNTLSLLNKHYKTVVQLCKDADLKTASAQFKQNPFPITYKNLKDSTMVNFKGFKYTMEQSDISGGVWHRYSQDTVTWRIPFFNFFKPEKTIEIPAAYIIPAEWTTIIERLKLHGVQTHTLTEQHMIHVESYKFSNPKWASRPYENHFTVKAEQKPIAEKRLFAKGSVIVPTNQRTVKAIVAMLEPKALDSFFYWGFFNPIFERKEYVEGYVMEERARLMLASDEKLKAEYEHKMKTDAAFAKSPRTILNWFYQKSPYYDKKHNVYPVGKIKTAQQLKNWIN